jgi:periplasmic copper chaperone A
MRITAIATAGFVALVLAPAAGAHVTVQPTELPSGGFARIDIRVPNESDDSGTVKVAVEFPDGIGFASYEPIPGWTVEIERETLAQPLETEDGQVTEQVKTITWTGDGEAGVIPPDAFQDFGVSMSVPEGVGRTVTFKAVQTYQNGDVERWIGEPDSDTPAPTVTLVEGGDDHHDAAAGSEDAETATGADTADHDDTAPAAVTWIALGLGGVALLAGGAALARGRRSA